MKRRDEEGEIKRSWIARGRDEEGEMKRERSRGAG